MKQIHFIILFVVCCIVPVTAQNTIHFPVNLGTKVETFTYTDTKDTKNYTNQMGSYHTSDVFYKFTTTVKMDLTVSHCGSVLKDTYIMLIREGSYGTYNIFEYSRDNNLQAGCNGRNQAHLNVKDLPAGTYWVGSKGKTENGLITTQISGVSEKLVTPVVYDFSIRTPPFTCSHTANTTNYPNSDPYWPFNDMYYTFSLSKKANIYISHEGSVSNENRQPACSHIALYNSSGTIIERTTNGCINGEYSFLEYQDLPAGSYKILSELAYNGAIKTTITGTSAYWHTLGEIRKSFTYIHTQDTRNGENNWTANPANDIHYELKTIGESNFYISQAGSQLQNTCITLVNAANKRVIASAYSEAGKNAELRAENVPAGSYYIISEGATDNGVITTSIEIDMRTPVEKNYVRTKTYRYEPGTEFLETIQYYNSLGYPAQWVQREVTPSKKNLVSVQEYDLFGRETAEWLPVTIADNGGYTDPLWLKEKNTFYDLYGDSAPYSKPVYENSPLNRIKESYGPGENWHTGGKAVRTNYLVNNNDMPCRLYTCSDDRTPLTITKKGNYAAGQLYVTCTADEEGQNITYGFTNKSGQLVLSRQQEGSVTHDTYYIYDSYGNLRVVLPPLAADALTTDGNWTETNAAIEQYAYLYTYDYRNRCVSKKLPGSGWNYYVYDQANRLILSQNAEQREKEEWLFMIPDALGRTVLTGTCKKMVDSPGNYPKAIWTGANNIYKGYEISDISLNGPVKVLSVNYYDRYDFLSLSEFSGLGYVVPPAGYGTRYTEHYNGLLTGTWTTDTEGEGNILSSAFYYDDRGRIIQQHTNHNGKKESEYTAFNFTGQPVKQQREYDTQTEYYTYTYDHAGRPVETRHRLNTGTERSLAQYTYDELGRLSNVIRNNRNELTENYSYNVRSWLTKLNGSRFSEILSYRFNGDISSMQWTTGNNTRKYAYSYDGLSRLTAADYTGTTTGKYNTAYRYDKHGNIQSLTRYGQTPSGSYGIVDNLQMAYTGNQLTALTNSISSTASQLIYNKNGALSKDSSKGITNISYNLLNLPNELTVNGITNKYTYAANGSKLKVEQGALTREYTGNKVYENGSLKRILFEGGYIENGTYHFMLTDHLGNVRVVTDQNGTVKQTNEYYPYGTLFAESTGGNTQPYKYNGKELDTTGGLDLYDYHARQYNPTIARFTTPDPLAEKYYNISPYAYVGNNPVRFIDPTGMSADWFQNGDDLIWRASKESTISENGVTYQNIGSTVSIANNDGSFSNYYQNIGFRSDQPFNAFGYIMNNNLQGKYMSGSSNLWEQGKIGLMKATVHQGQQDFLNHPVTQGTINSTLFVATGGIEGITGVVNLGKSLLENGLKKGVKNFFDGAKYSDKVIQQMANANDRIHAFPKSVDGYANKFGLRSTKIGGDGQTYNWLEMKGSYKGRTGTFEYIKNPKTGEINHRFFNIK